MKGFKNSTRMVGDHCFAEGGRVAYDQPSAKTQRDLEASVRRAGQAEIDSDARAARKLGMSVKEYDKMMNVLSRVPAERQNMAQRRGDMLMSIGMPGAKQIREAADSAGGYARGGRVRSKGVPAYSGKPLIGK